MPHLRAALSVSESAVARAFCGGSRETRTGRSGDEVAELHVVDRGCLFGCCARLLQGSLRHAFDRSVDRFWCRFRQRSGYELQRRGAREPLRDLRRLVCELEAPYGVTRVHDQRAIALEAGRPCVPSDLVADRGRPRRDRVADPALRTEACELALQLGAERLHHAASRTAPGTTSSSWSGSAGSIAASVAVISAWPTRATRAARMRRRSGSSSERTSSSKSSGGTPRRATISSASASRSASTASRCSPCEPKLRSSHAPDAITTSSRAGPSPVTPRSRSRSSRFSSAATEGGVPS